MVSKSSTDQPPDGGFVSFAFRGSVVGLAAGVILGSAFSAVVQSLVNDVALPLLGLILPGERGYSGWMWSIHGEQIRYGNLIGALVNFLVVAGVLYLLIDRLLGVQVQTPPTKVTSKPLL